MPRTFSPAERLLIIERLRDTGRRAFAARGLRHVTVDDLAREAGISKGGFYLFFDSKEALLLDLLQGFEADFQRKILDEVLRAELGPIQSLRMLLKTAVAVRGTDPLLRNLSDTDMAILMRRIPPDQAAALLEADVASARRFVDYWREQGRPIGVDAEVLTGLMRAIVLTAFRQHEIGASVYEQVVHVLIDSVAQRLGLTDEHSSRSRTRVG
jgi:AcrR family transcriptional regulator